MQTRLVPALFGLDANNKPCHGGNRTHDDVDWSQPDSFWTLFAVLVAPLTNIGCVVEDGNETSVLWLPGSAAKVQGEKDRRVQGAFDPVRSNASLVELRALGNQALADRARC